MCYCDDQLSFSSSFKCFTCLIANTRIRSIKGSVELSLEGEELDKTLKGGVKTGRKGEERSKEEGKEREGSER